MFLLFNYEQKPVIKTSFPAPSYSFELKRQLKADSGFFHVSASSGLELRLHVRGPRLWQLYMPAPSLPAEGTSVSVRRFMCGSAVRIDHFSVWEQGFAVIVYNEQEMRDVCKLTYVFMQSGFALVHNNTGIKRLSSSLELPALSLIFFALKRQLTPAEFSLRGTFVLHSC